MRKGWVAIFFGAFAVDRLAKHWAIHMLSAAPGGAMDFWPGLLGWRFATNTGAAFSFFQGQDLLLIGLPLLMVLVTLGYLLFKKEASPLLRAGLSLIAAGGAGNLLDRLLFGYVIDFFELQFMRFAIFNTADAFITVGAALIILWTIRSGGGERDGARVPD